MTKTNLYASQQSVTKSRQILDHSAFYPTIRQSDVFVCSYPKSGTTWLGYLIAQTLRRDDDNTRMGLNSFTKYVPDVNLLYTKRGSLAQYNEMADPRFLLCHAMCDEHMPKVVYVIRDPRDTMVSYWHYRKFLSPDFNLPLADFLTSKDHWPCDWDEHVTSWLLPQSHPHLLLVRYEDMHKDAAAVLRRVLEFAGVQQTAARIEAAVEASRFENMRAAEERFGVIGKAGDENERFVRKGRVGSWQEEMGYSELRILEEKYGNVMRQVGYTPLS
jgi:estrone sulfotransferase